MGKDVELSKNEKVEVKKVKKKANKSKKTRKSDPVVNDISSLLSNNLCLISPNGSFNSEKEDGKKKSLSLGQTASINNKKQRRSKSLNRNVSSSSLDNFVVRTSRKSEELKENPRLQDDFEVKENVIEMSKLSDEKNVFKLMMGNRNKIEDVTGKEMKLKENGLTIKEKKVGKKRKKEELDGDLKLIERTKRLKEDDVSLICVNDENEDEKCEEEGVIKIKMFSPQVFKRKRKNGNELKSNLKEEGLLTYSENSNDSIDSDTFILRRSNRKRNVKKFNTFDDEDTNDFIIDVESVEEIKKNKTKVAPIFLLSTPKPKLNPEALEAKKKFLSSGIPESLKKLIEKEKNYELHFDVFPKISHIQQKTKYEEINFWNLPKPDLNLNFKMSPIKNNQIKKWINLINLKENKIEIDLTSPKKLANFKEILQKIKGDNPTYPVFKSFRILNEKTKLFERKLVKKRGRKSKELNVNENFLVNHEMWTEKYKPSSYKDIFGNNKKVLELKSWLESWVEYINDSQSVNKIDDDFYGDSNSNFSNFSNLSNAIIVTGPFGSGKTMTIYAICNELGVNVIELNASSRRTGKLLLQEIQEATQSHQVRKIDPFLTKKSNSDNKKLCLILIEDLDIIFDQDEGFLSALNQLVLTTKRPIAITTSDINANILQKFVNQYPVVKFSGISQNVLGVWLQIVCLFEGVVIDLSDLGKILEFFNGDVRKTLIQLQFFVQSGGSLFKSLNDGYLIKNNIKSDVLNEKDDENYLCSVESKNSGEKDFFIHKDFIYNFLSRDCLIYDFNLDKIWWNLPIILDEDSDLKKCDCVGEVLSFIDVFYRKSNSSQHFSYIKDNISLIENINFYQNEEFNTDLSNTLLKNSIHSYNEVGKFEFDKPTLGQKRWLKKQQDCSKTFSHFAPFTYHTDKRSFALDYYPNLRAISRSEKHRASVNVKRGKRFYNYLKSLDFTCCESTTDTVCKIFSIEND